MHKSLLLYSRQLLLGLSLISLTHTAQADNFLPSVVGVHTVSWHTQPGFNNRNPGLYLQWNNGLNIGSFYNSYKKTSVYGGWLWNLDDGKHFGVLFGLASGYGAATQDEYPVVPLVAPTLRFNMTQNTSVRFTYSPDPRKGAAQVFHMSFEWRFAK